MFLSHKYILNVPATDKYAPQATLVMETTSDSIQRSHVFPPSPEVLGKKIKRKDDGRGESGRRSVLDRCD